MRPGYWASCGAVVLLSACATGAYAEEFLPAANQKVKAAQQVYDQLTRSIGDSRTPPELRIVKGKAATFDVALFFPGRHAIYIEEQFYDVVQSALPKQRPHALALILGHELAHFYRNHRWAEGFSRAFTQRQQESSGNAPVSANAPRETADERRRLEAEADYFAGFYSYLAGFHTLSIAPQVFDAIYHHYQLDPALPAYEHLRHRKETAREAQQRLREWLPLFDAGVQSLLIHDYTSAGRIFDRVATEFPSPEVFNNAGVADALAALEWYPESDAPFTYPIELDPESRLAGGEQRGAPLLNQEDRVEYRRSLLVRAKRNFEKAIALNPSYVTATINLACALDLLGDYESARTKAADAQMLGLTQHLSLARAHAHTVAGIVLAHQNQREFARHEFELATKMGDRTAAHNLEHLLNPDGGGSPEAEARRTLAVHPPEQLVGVKIAEVGEKDFLNDKGTRTLGRWDAVDEALPGLTILTKEQGSVRATALIRGSGSARSTVFLLSTLRAAEGQTGKGIRRGQKVVDVERAYGSPTSTLVSGRSNYSLYQSPYREDLTGIIFQFDENQTLQEWVVFRTER